GPHERAAESVAVAPVAHLTELDQAARLVLGHLVASEQRRSGLDVEELRVPLVRGNGLDAEVGSGGSQAVSLLERRVERRGGEIDLVELRRERERQAGAVEQDRHAVHQPEALELEDRGAGCEPERLRLVHRGRTHLAIYDARRGRQPARRRHLRQAHQRIGRLSDGRASDGPAAGGSPRDDAAPLELRQSAPERHAAHAEVLRERALRRERRAGRPPVATDLLRERLLNALVAELEPVEDELVAVGGTHARNYRPARYRNQPDPDRWRDPAPRLP